jgi:glutathione-regulated potassium-efflux system ancillary protein KefF
MDGQHQTPGAQAASPPTAPPSQPIYLLAAHDNWRESRVNRRLLERARGNPAVEVCDLYGRYTDYAIDVATEQARLLTARLVVLMHPIHWYSMPALQKLWLDEVLTYGWAYGPQKLLAGKDLWLVASTGGAQDSYQPQGYNRYAFDAFLPPYEQTAALCGMRFLPPLVLHGAHRATEADLQAHADAFSRRLQSYPDWADLADLACQECEVPASERPPADE